TLYNAALAATGGVPPYAWTISGTPDGIVGSSSGTISGTPTQSGSFVVSGRVTDSKGVSTSFSFPITITGPELSISTVSLPAATVGVPYTASVTATGGSGAPYTFTATGLPAGVSLSSAGVFSGAPGTPGTATIIV